MSLIHVFRSSLDDVWTSYISGPAAEALIRNIPLSSFATSRTINFCSGITGGFWSFNTFKAWRKKTKTKHQSSLHGAVFITDFFTECVPQLQMCTSGLFLGGRWGYLWVAAPGRLGKITTGGKTVRSDRMQKWHMNFWVSCITFESPGGSLPQEHPLVFEHLSGPHHILLAEGVSALQLSCAAVLHAIKDFL